MSTAGDQLFDDLMRFKPAELSPNGWAVKAGVSRTVWTDLRKHGNPSRRTLEKLLTAVGSSLAEFEALRIGEPPKAIGQVEALGEAGHTWRAAPLAPLPLLASATGYLWGEPDRQIDIVKFAPHDVIDRLPRPTSLAAERDAYALTVFGDSMWPRFRPGRRIAIAPGVAAAVGDDVLVQLADPAKDGWAPALIKELVGRSAGGIELRQFNPPQSFTLAAGEFVAIHKVAGELF